MDTGATSHRFQQVGVAENLSQLIRSNTLHYWNYMKRKADLSGLRRYLPFEGIIAGDPHLGNFSVVPLKRIGGSRQMRFVDIDFDDAGRGPFVLDIVRYLIASKSIHKQIKNRPLETSYLAGLMGKKAAPPNKVRALLAMPVAQYDAKAATYAEKNSSKEGFIFKGEIAPYKAKKVKIARATIAGLFPDEKIIDLARRCEVRGGSVGELRVWVLVESGKSRRIMELKEYGTPATAKYRTQPPVREWLNDVRRTFWPGLDGSAYDLIEVPGAGLFWKREKHVTLIDVPYSSLKPSEIAFLEALAIYDANVLGLTHGRQAEAVPYRSLVENDPEAFHQAVKPVVKSYLELARANFREK